MNSFRHEYSDAELLEAYARGNMQAFDQLYKRYEKGIFAVTLSYHKDRIHAEESLQEIFIKMLQKLPQLEDKHKFKSWFFMLARNHCLDKLRAVKTQQKYIDDKQKFVETSSPSPKQCCMSHHDQQGLAGVLEAALQSLPSEQREVFVLREKEQFTFEEIADMTEATVNTVKSRMRYALQTLRQKLSHKPIVKELLS